MAITGQRPPRADKPAWGSWSGRWHQLRRPLQHVVPLPALLLLAAGRVLLAGTVLVVPFGLAGLEAAAKRRTEQRRRAAAQDQAALLGYLDTVLELIRDDWIAREAARGQAELEHWRRTHRS